VKWATTVSRSVSGLRNWQSKTKGVKATSGNCIHRIASVRTYNKNPTIIDSTIISSE